MPKPPPGFEWDERKAAYNYAKHGVSFASVKDFEFETAVVTEDLRADHAEERMFALGKIGRTIHVLIFAHRKEKRRVISLRKVTAHERTIYFAAGGQ